jgi:hypothetical protein
MAHRGRALVCALTIATVLPSVAMAQAWPRVDAPACEPALDLSRVRSVLAIDLAQHEAMRGVSLEIGAEVCDPASARVRFVLRDQDGLRAEGEVGVADVSARERTLALALAERVRLFVARRDAASAIPPHEQVVAPRSVPPIVIAPPSLSVTVGASVVARWLVIGGGWLAGARADTRLIFSPLVIGLELGAHGSRGEIAVGSVEATLFEIALVVGVQTRPLSELAVEISARGSLAAVHAIGRPIGGGERSTTQPWSSVELVASSWLWIDPRVALGVALSIGAIVYGLTIRETDGTPLDLTGLIGGLELGARFAP